MATWFKFTKDFNHSIKFGMDKQFRAGQTVFLKDEEAEAAEKAKAGERITREEAKPDARRRNA